MNQIYKPNRFATPIRPSLVLTILCLSRLLFIHITLYTNTLAVPVHVAQEPGQAGREAMQIVPDALNEAIGQRLQLGDDKVAVRLQVRVKLWRALASKLFQPFRWRIPGGNIFFKVGGIRRT